MVHFSFVRKYDKMAIRKCDSTLLVGTVTVLLHFAELNLLLLISEGHTQFVYIAFSLLTVSLS